MTCGNCKNCRNGRETLCLAPKGNIGQNRDGGYAEYVSLPERNVVAIPDGTILAGAIPAPKMTLVRAWIEIHRDELLADWDLASSGQPPYKIEPLR